MLKTVMTYVFIAQVYREAVPKAWPASVSVHSKSSPL